MLGIKNILKARFKREVTFGNTFDRIPVKYIAPCEYDGELLRYC